MDIHGLSEDEQEYRSSATSYQSVLLTGLSKQQLSHWIVMAISLAYNSRGFPLPHSERAHSTRGMTSSWTFRVSVSDICATARWSSLHAFVRFYHLDVTAPLVTFFPFCWVYDALECWRFDSSSVAALRGVNTCPISCVVQSESTERERNVMTVTSVP